MIPKQPPGVGNRLIRLADLPADQLRRVAMHEARQAKTAEEAMRLLYLARNPGDAGGRIAA